MPVSSLLLRMLEMTEKSLENAERGEGPPDLDVVLRLHNTKQDTAGGGALDGRRLHDVTMEDGRSALGRN